MILNPQKIVDDKILQYPDDIDWSIYVQQNGIDITVDRVFDINFKEIPIVGIKDSYKPSPILLEPVAITSYSKGFVFKKGNVYTAESDFFVTVPEGMCASVIGRSTFNRQGLLIRSSLYDSGFNGNVGFTIYCFNNFKVEKGARIGQIVFTQAENSSLYSGQYQTNI
jgi:deoxycytidine triphosphate deaminase